MTSGATSRTTNLSPVTSVMTVSGFCSTNLMSSALTTMRMSIQTGELNHRWPAFPWMLSAGIEKS